MPFSYLLFYFYYLISDFPSLRSIVRKTVIKKREVKREQQGRWYLISVPSSLPFSSWFSQSSTGSEPWTQERQRHKSTN
jgi:hypothetical protein